MVKAIFGLTPNKDAVHRSVLSEMATVAKVLIQQNLEVWFEEEEKNLGSKKVRGVARAGTNRSPIWRGGGTVFGPEPYKYEYNLPKKIKRLALKVCFVSKD